MVQTDSGPIAHELFGSRIPDDRKEAFSNKFLDTSVQPR